MVLHYVGYVFAHIPLRGAPSLIVGIAGLLGTIALGIGFGLYARGKGHSWAWSFLALIGLLGLVILLLVPDKAASERDPESASSLRASLPLQQSAHREDGGEDRRHLEREERPGEEEGSAAAGDPGGDA